MLTLSQIKERITDIRCEVEELAEECWSSWGEDEGEELYNLSYELDRIGGELENLEEEEE